MGKMQHTKYALVSCGDKMRFRQVNMDPEKGHIVYPLRFFNLFELCPHTVY